MDNKKINKKAEASLFSLILSMVLVIGVFTGLFLWVSMNAEEQGVTIDSKYNQTYQAFSSATNNISNNIDEISENTKGITEADNALQVAWNGLKGLGSVLKLPIKFVDSGQTLFDASSTQVTGIIPSWAVTLIRILIIAFMVLLVVYLLMGGGKPI